VRTEPRLPLVYTRSRLCSPLTFRFQALFLHLPSLRGTHKKDDHKHFRGGECDDSLPASPLPIAHSFPVHPVHSNLPALARARPAKVDRRYLIEAV